MATKNIRTLASEIAKLEGKRSQARIGDIREILKLLSVKLVTEEWVLNALLANGLRIRKRQVADRTSKTS